MSGRVVLLTSNWLVSRALAQALVSSGIVLSGILIEEAAPTLKSAKDILHRFIKNALKFCLGEDGCWRLVSSPWSAEARALFLAESRSERDARRLITEFIGGKRLSWPDTHIQYTRNVNSDDACVFLERQAPDLIAVFGTGLLKHRTIEAARLGCINAHTAVLPDYRGAFPEFWQIYNEDYDKTGISIHFIDAGVDTGDIIFTRHVPVCATTDPATLRALNFIQIVRDYPKVIDEVLAGTASRVPQGESSTRTYRVRELTEDKKRDLFRRLRLM